MEELDVRNDDGGGDDDAGVIKEGKDRKIEGRIMARFRRGEGSFKKEK